MAILPLPPSGVAFIDPITGGVSVQWQNYLLSLSTISGGFAPIDARYWVSTPDSTLTNETNLGALTTGYMKLTVAAGVGTPSTVATIPGTDITGAALTKTDDTNVTLTLGGTPLTALLRAASLTLGWTGTLARDRGGLGNGSSTAHGVLIGNGTGAVNVTGTGSSGQVLTSNGAAADPTYQTPTAGTVTSVAATVPGGFSISGSPVTASGTLAIGANGNSGGVLAYTGTTTMASSAPLGANQLVLGGGAATVPFSESGFTIEQTAHTLSSTTQTRCVAFNSSTQSINDSTYTALALDSEDLDVGGMHDTVTNNSRLTVPTGAGGFYQVFGQVEFAPNATGVRTLRLTKNGSTDLAYTQYQGVSAASLITMPNIIWAGVLAAADYVELYAQQTSGGALNTGNAVRGLANALTAVKLW